jgi:hypothetical protein
MSEKISRGERNCNPLNLVRGIQWKGLRKEQNDSRFCQFISMKYGWRAALITLRSYITGLNGKRRPNDTIEKIITRWAPPSENDTENYIKCVSAAVGIDRRMKVKWQDRVFVCAICKAMAYQECGKLFPIDDIYSVYDIL